MQVTGQCLCGAVTYRAEIKQDVCLVCHCTECQQHSGSPYRAVAAVADHGFELLTGELRAIQRVADSGRLRERAFCPACGTNLYAADAGGGGFMGLRLGTIDQRAELVPRVQIWCRSAQPWALLPGVPQFPGQPAFEELAALLQG